jgi:hypothetical protein
LNPDDPQALESALAAYRRLPRAEPDAALDAAIKARARAAVAVRPRARWPVLFATAATVLLGASLGWRAWRSGSDQPVPLVAPSAPTQSSVRSEPGAAAPERMHQRESEMGAAAESLQRQAKEERAPAGAPERSQPAPDPTLGLREAQASRDSEATTPAVSRSLAEEIVAFPAAAPAPPASAPPAETARIEVAGAVAAMESLSKATVQPAADAIAPLDTNATDAAPGNAAHADPPAPAAMGALRANSAAGASAGHDRMRRRSGDPASVESGLQAIRELQRQGRLDEARQALEAWQRDWPDAVVPKDLQALLQ